MVKIEEMLAQGMKTGRKIEITLFEGVQFDDGLRSRVPTIHPRGFYVSIGTTSKEGNKVVGYALGFDLGQGIHKLSLTSSSSKERDLIYFVEEGTIHSYSLL